MALLVNFWVKPLYCQPKNNWKVAFHSLGWVAETLIIYAMLTKAACGFYYVTLAGLSSELTHLFLSTSL